MSQYLVVEAQEARKSDFLYRKFHVLNVTNLLTFNYAENISYLFCFFSFHLNERFTLKKKTELKQNV